MLIVMSPCCLLSPFPRERLGKDEEDEEEVDERADYGDTENSSDFLPLLSGFAGKVNQRART